MPLPSNRNLDELRDVLERWLAGVSQSGSEVAVSELDVPQASGFSSETFFFKARFREGSSTREQRYVARLRPETSNWPVFPEYDLDLQFQCLRLVREHSKVPVPVAPWIEKDDSHLGTDFYVMEHVDGQAPPDNPPYVFAGWVLDASAKERERLQHSYLRNLAALHAIDLSNTDAGFLDRPRYGRSPMDQHLGYQRFYYDWARGEDHYPILEKTFDWLEAHRPADYDEAPGFNWGDARVGNMLFQDFETSAVLDWEMAALGPPEVDVAWQLAMHQFFADMAERAGAPGIPGFLNRDFVVRTYEELSGHKLRDIDWFVMFGGLRYGIISIRTSARALAMGQMEDPGDLDGYIMNKAIMERILRGEPGVF
jgi:aminoglycoside phosphotransferase (APT) family kinase protein